ncbi:tRNA (adenosine(37)-N6)-threonylcarbamoyltransferase complex dimerization subunit type 1 TsaB [Brevundimonas sp. SORGH_AS_0993]|uniref:tRNA (adenosine(37)-N6)-threonylcarbamoyltransferase complex dimerization subunit type 1 TsaB n=1 Tax=Brevundimonas sp. SORGH_AS_0993 TaxID=3041794 RepID=UPI002789041F|nr:tRNA (adenosine(37)-N6)-threonylcarbamoyltransferase complex dimerization subunit type 1 TsaB [Brevundimonas sp. SORGH_AS_0993]MDQ1155020.1 tRNA threonylcarbamoyladenosine biosynthesis protein TsaB [Brevundimonas sp. SORGH_AS_0993]
MRLLVIDTAMGACTAAVFQDDRALSVRFELMAKGHQERLGGLVRDVAAEAGGGFAALDRIGVTVGPGSFTGLRVGLAFAQGLGAALGRPVVGLSTLAALAASLEEAGGPVAALIDARRGQVYARFLLNGAALGPDEALTLDVAAARLAALTQEVGGPARLVGSGAAVLREAFPDLAVGAVDPRAAPSPQALARLARAADPAACAPRPLYLRAPDATPPSRLPGQPRQPAA